ncbi:hypothetical protein ACB092_07G189000 [Castanea dentata]
MFGSSNPFIYRSCDVFTAMGRCWVLEDEFSYPIDPTLRNNARVHNTMRQEWAWLLREQEMFYDELVVTLDRRIQAILEESQQFLNPNKVVPPESNEQQRLLRISLQICGTVAKSLPMASCAPKCEKTVQVLLCQNLNVKSITLPNATSSRRIRLQDDLVIGFHFLVSERFVPGCTLKASIVELI